MDSWLNGGCPDDPLQQVPVGGAEGVRVPDEEAVGVDPIGDRQRFGHARGDVSEGRLTREVRARDRAGLHAGGLQMTHEGGAVAVDQHREGEPGVNAVGRLGKDGDPGDVREPPTPLDVIGAPPGHPGVEPGELGETEGRLHLGGPQVVAGAHEQEAGVDFGARGGERGAIGTLTDPAVGAQRAQAVRQRIVGGEHHAALDGRQVVREEEAEARCEPMAAGALAFDDGAVRPARVLEDEQPGVA